MADNSNNEVWVFLSHSNRDYEKVRQISNKSVLKSESGSFHVDKNGIAQRFEPAGDNPFIDEKTELNDNYIHRTEKSIRTFIVPGGVKGFASDFMRGVRVLERFELPNDLLIIGHYSFDIEDVGRCVFADCIIPSIVIPESVHEIGSYAFGHTHIGSLQLPTTIRSPYGRQFKDSYIGVLRMPHEWMGMASLGKYNNLRLSGLLNSDEFGYLRWPSTYVERLEFY